MPGRREFYIGRSGQLVVMAEFLRRGYNAAIPEVDMGEDIVVIEDATGKLSRIQVKASIGKGVKSMRGEFSVTRRQLEKPRHPELWYVFALYHTGLWREFIVIRRDTLLTLHERDGMGSPSSRGESWLRFYIAYHADDVRSKGVSLQKYRNNWSQWPEIQP